VRQTIATAALVIALVAVGAVAWGLTLRPPLVVDPAPLAALPHRLDSWVAEDVPLESAVESMLRADFNIQRLYRHPLGDRIWLYIGYYGTERGGRPEHTPAVCYTAQGWRILERRTLDVAGVPGLRVNEFVVEQGGQRQLVHFWYRSYRSTGLLGGLDQTLDRLFGRLLEGRADGALVRISTTIPGSDVTEERTQLLHFAAALDPQLAAYWPKEVVRGSEPAKTARAGSGTGGLVGSDR
jgi:EpsI family protein